MRFPQWLSEKRIHLKKNLPAIQETQEMQVSPLGQGRSPGGSNGNPLQYSHLKKSQGAWQATCSPQGHKKSEMTERLSTFLKNMYLFPWLLCVSVMALGTLSCGVWGPAPQPGMEPRSPRWKRGLTASWPPGKSLHSYFDVFEVSRKKNLKAGKCIHTIYTHNGNRSVN